ncbi:DUF3575 domain-containing protein [Bacteroides fragilis]|nr:DUF3575 domain-containing protein [Bacteroides fragilis]
MNTFNLKLDFPNLLWEIAGYNFPSLFGKWAIFFIFIAISFQVSAQRMAIKTNTLEWLAASPNLGVEFPLNDWMTAEISASANPWKITDKLFYRHGRVQAEAKYWLRRPAGTPLHRYHRILFHVRCGNKPQGILWRCRGAGVTYGYNWILSRRWNLEVSGGVGVARYRLVRYQPGSTHGEPNESGWAPIPVKLSVSFIYIAK